MDFVMDFTIDISLGDILNSFIGAFFGFGLTLLIELIVSSFRNCSLRKKSLTNLKVELNDIKDAISKCSDDDELIIDIPIWETIVQSGGIFLLYRKVYYLDLLKTYSRIKLLVEQEKDEQCDIDELQKSREAVKNDICNLLSLL